MERGRGCRRLISFGNKPLRYKERTICSVYQYLASLICKGVNGTSTNALVYDRVIISISSLVGHCKKMEVSSRSSNSPLSTKYSLIASGLMLTEGHANTIRVLPSTSHLIRS